MDIPRPTPAEALIGAGVAECRSSAPNADDATVLEALQLEEESIAPRAGIVSILEREVRKRGLHMSTVEQIAGARTGWNDLGSGGLGL